MRTMLQNEKRPSRRVMHPVRMVVLLLGFVMLLTSRPATAAQAAAFEATIVGTLISLEGNELKASLEGSASFDGQMVAFTGLLTEILVGRGAAATGTIDLAFSDDQQSTLTLFFADEAASGPLHGGWSIMNGTGRFENAQGGGRWEGQFLTLETAVLRLTGTVVIP